MTMTPTSMALARTIVSRFIRKGIRVQGQHHYAGYDTCLPTYWGSYRGSTALVALEHSHDASQARRPRASVLPVRREAAARPH